MATYEEAYKASLEYYDQDSLAAKTFVDKYALCDNEGDFKELTPDDMHKRLAKELARIENKYPNPLSEEEIYNLLKNHKFIIPQGSPSSAIGNPYKLQSSGNCYVVEPPLDSYGGILKTDQELAQLMKRRAGVGCDLSNIRPKGLPTKNAAGTTDGISVFMERFSNTCREVAQNGRRGAELQSISVAHPEVLTFIKIKQDKSKVTGANISIRITDEFMEAVKKDQEFRLRWPVDSETPAIQEWVRARDIWDELIKCAWASAEPGLLFWDTIIKYSPADIYAEKYPDFKTTSTNPCFSGDTLIAVADGRNAVSIKQLAEEGKDVPVYSVNKETGIISIKMARHPRITGYNQQLVRVWVDDKNYFDTTLNHKFLLRDGTIREASKLKKGDSLSPFYKRREPAVQGGKDYYLIQANARNLSNKRIFEHRLIAEYYYPEIWKNKYKEEKSNGWHNGGLVVHHKDYDSLNNRPDNLEIMSFKEHTKLHASMDTQGEKNGRFSGHSNEELQQHALELTKIVGQRFSKKMWQEYADIHGLPKLFTKYRKDSLGSVLELSKWAATELGLEYIDYDPRLVRSLQEAREQGYKADIVGNEPVVYKICEECDQEFSVRYKYRETCYCSNLCATGKRERLAKVKSTYIEKGARNKDDQAKVYSALKHNLGRQPLHSEWEKACKEGGVAFRLKTKYGFKSYKEVVNAGENYNHKVVKVELLEGEHTVYNLTVDDNHTVAIVNEVKNKKGNIYFSGVSTLNCGELPLGKDSCRLTLVNLFSFVTDPFTKKAKFDFDLFDSVVQKAQRIMDDIVDLEIEIIERIIKKIKSDPEPAAVKQIELDLWKGYLTTCRQGRRTGLGPTAVGDAVAALSVRYGSNKSIKLVEDLYKHMAINAYKSSCIMAGERGSFPIFDSALEKNHPFLERVFKADPEVYKLYKKHGRRNVALLTTAPAGSMSILAQVTSGIEPAFLVSYTRRKKINPSDKGARADFIDHMGDRWQEFTVYHHRFKQWMEITGESDVEKSPYFKATSNDVDWEASVELQAAAQKWVDHSISRTCNIPNNASQELVSKIYLLAWEKGCKGFTVYRDGCRTGVLVTNKESKDEKGRPTSVQATQAPKRPASLPCDIYHGKVHGEPWTILVGLLNGVPYELFGGPSAEAGIPKSVKNGFMAKTKVSKLKNCYTLSYVFNNEEKVVEDIGNTFENKSYGTFTRTLSLALRHGAPVQHIVEQLRKDKSEELNSLSSVLGRALKKYITDGAAVASVAGCDKCGSGNLKYSDGCPVCLDCGYTKCS